MKKIWLMSLLVLAITVAAVQPALAATEWDLNIHNNTEGTVKVNLTGPKNYSFDVVKGKTIKTVREGDYKYTYTTCGKKFSGEITVEDDLQWLIIDPCAAILEYAKFVVDSHLPGPLTLGIVGPDSFDLQIELGVNKFISLPVGWYAFSYDACGATYTGEVHILKNGTARLTLYGCEVVDYRMSLTTASSQAPSNLRIASHYAFPIRITLLGPSNYSFELVPGLNRLNVVRGDYSFFYTAYGLNRSGTFSVGESGTSFIVSPVK
ncbi:MAG: hypothetical protein WEA61_01820 [Anaerolineales bacterium]